MSTEWVDCGGAHEISGIKAPLFLRGWVGGGMGDGVLSGWCAMGIIIFEGVLTKFNFLMKIPHLSKFIDLMKDLKYEHQSFFSLWGRVKLNFRDR